MAGLTQQTSERDRIFGTKAGSENGKSENVENSAGTSPLCPQCGSTRVWRDALRYSVFGDRIQRWLCRGCGRRFSDPHDVQKVWSTFERLQRVDTKPKKATDDIVSTRQICVTETKNLAAEQQTTEVLRRNETEVKGKITEYVWWMKKQGYSESTIMGRSKLLQILAKRGAELYDPESAKTTIAKQQWCEGRKANAVDAYSTFLKMLGGKWEAPHYKSVAKLPFIPKETEIDQLISGCSKRMATFLESLKETAMRSGEAWQLKWTDIDFTTNTIRITPEKGSNPRIIHVSKKLTAMLETLPKNYGDRVFSNPHQPLDHYRDNFCQQRKRIASKLQSSRILRITFHTFRHWKGTIEYHRTKDILHVMQLLGHKNIKNTLIYVQLAEELFKDDQDYISKVAKTETEICSLVEAGFEYVCEFEGHKIFKKKKY
jgi:integrase/ribosomal protein L37AE/L43A